MDCEADRLWRQLGVLFQMGEIVSKSTGKGAVRIARIAGQYGKPRSKPTEVVEGHGEIMSFKGDNINGYESRSASGTRSASSRATSTRRRRSTTCAASSRAASSSASPSSTSARSRADFSDCRPSPHYSRRAARCARATGNSLQFFAGFAIFRAHLLPSQLRGHLHVARGDAARPRGGAHARGRRARATTTSRRTWCGSATGPASSSVATSSTPPAGRGNRGNLLATTGRSPLLPRSLHRRYFRGISNPVGCKVGPSMKNDELTELVQILNPNKEEAARADHAVRPRQDRRAAARAHRGGQGVGRPRRLAVRRRARQHGHRQIGGRALPHPARPPPPPPPPPPPTRSPSFAAAGGPEGARVRRRHVRMPPSRSTARARRSRASTSSSPGRRR